MNFISALSILQRGGAIRRAQWGNRECHWRFHKNCIMQFASQKDYDNNVKHDFKPYPISIDGYCAGDDWCEFVPTPARDVFADPKVGDVVKSHAGYTSIIEAITPRAVTLWDGYDPWSSTRVDFKKLGSVGYTVVSRAE